MQFVPHGPDVPDRLIQAHADGRVVFFCGAGVSFRAGLPGFGDLVDAIYAGLGEAPDHVEALALKRYQYDTALDLLEHRVTGGRQVVRRQVWDALQPNLALPGALSTHEALLQLAQHRQHECRLVTTNFDRLFELATAPRTTQPHPCNAPLLPVPKSRWDGLVYLHGLMPETYEERALDKLVLSSGDFGLAYLTERWASRFLTSLFQSFTVCFVGYSINDAVLRYMMDALAADRVRGDASGEAFVFAESQPRSVARTTLEWQAKHVVPVLYNRTPDHRHLHDTLSAWARVHRDGVVGRTSIVAKYGSARPTPRAGDDFVGRLIWAVADSTGIPARAFADQLPTPPIDWLGPFTDKRFGHADLDRFGVRAVPTEDPSLRFSLLARPCPYTLAPLMAAVSMSRVHAGQWDDVMWHLARWLSCHLHSRALLAWTLKDGGCLRPEFVRAISHKLDRGSVQEPWNTIWRMFVTGQVAPTTTYDSTIDIHELLSQGASPSAVTIKLRQVLTPRLRFVLREDQPQEAGDDAAAPRVLDVVSIEIVLDGGSHVRSMLRYDAAAEPWIGVLHRLADDATTLLADAIALRQDLGDANGHSDRSYWDIPSISEHSQNVHLRDWTFLVELCRDAFRALATATPSRAHALALRWAQLNSPVFKRLALFAACDGHVIPTPEALAILLDANAEWLWSVETQREAMRLVVALAPRLATVEQHGLWTAILAGPPGEMYRRDADPELIQRLAHRSTWLVLSKLQSAGAELPIEASERLAGISAQYPDWRLAVDQSDEFPVWRGGDEDWRTLLRSPEPVHELAEWLWDHPNHELMRDDDWRTRCREDVERTKAALLSLATQGRWVSSRWEDALDMWSAEPFLAESWLGVSEVLATAPDEAWIQMESGVMRWLLRAVNSIDVPWSALSHLTLRTISLNRDTGSDVPSDRNLEALNHPVGIASEATLSWIFRSIERHSTEFVSEAFAALALVCALPSPGLRSGRVVLARNAASLFHHDATWTRAHLIPLFSWTNHTEAVGAWQGYAWSGQLFGPLLEALHDPFLSTASHYAQLDQYASRYASALVLGGVDLSTLISHAQCKRALGVLPPSGLEAAAEALARFQVGSAEHGAAYWTNRMKPFILAAWPRSRELLTSGISTSFAEICIAANTKFADAVQELRPWLHVADHRQLICYRLSQTQFCTDYPAAALDLLSRTVDTTHRWPDRHLAQCLRAILAAKPELELTPAFVDLAIYVQQYGGRLDTTE